MWTGFPSIQARQDRGARRAGWVEASACYNRPLDSLWEVLGLFLYNVAREKFVNRFL
jgi:hypothetical protein